jgi:hypothetical protein
VGLIPEHFFELLMTVAPGTPPDRRALPWFRLRSLVPAILLLLLLPVGALAQPLAGFPHRDDWDFLTRDTYLMLQARRALLLDPDLAPLNLGVSVHGGVATLWGTAPSVDLAVEAAALLRQLPDLAEVRNELEVDSLLTVDMEPPPPPPLRRPHSQQEALAATDRQGPAPGALAGRADRGPAPGAAQPLPRATPAPPGDSVSLLAPVPLSGQPAPAPRPPVPASPGLTLAQRVVQLRDQEARWHRIQVEVRDRAVILHGVVARGEDLMDLARGVSRLPGVERVVLGNVQVGTPGAANRR